MSLQTLDDRAFDHGAILAQTPQPGILIPPSATVQELTRLLAPIGAQMLVQGLRDGVHVPPRQSAGWKADDFGDTQLIHAPKVTKADGQADWVGWSADEFARRVRVLGSVWTRAVNKRGEVKRIIIQDAETLRRDMTDDIGAVSFLGGSEADIPRERRVQDLGDGSLLVHLSNGEGIRIKRVKEEGKPDRDAAVVFKSFTS